jgi:hypothetical protein
MSEFMGLVRGCEGAGGQVWHAPLPAAGRGDPAPFEAVLGDARLPEMPRRHALWGLGQIGARQPAALAAVRHHAQHAEPGHAELRAQAEEWGVPTVGLPNRGAVESALTNYARAFPPPSWLIEIVETSEGRHNGRASAKVA